MPSRAAIRAAFARLLARVRPTLERQWEGGEVLEAMRECERELTEVKCRRRQQPESK